MISVGECIFVKLANVSVILIILISTVECQVFHVAAVLDLVTDYLFFLSCSLLSFLPLNFLLILLFSPPITPSSASTSAGSQRWPAVHLRPRGWTGSHASGWTRWSRCPTVPSSLSVSQPPRPPPDGDRLCGDSLHACHGTGQQQQGWVCPEALLLPVSAQRHQQPHEPNVVPRGVRVPLFQSRLFLFLQ